MSSLLWLGSIGRPSQEDWQLCWGSRAVCFWQSATSAVAPGLCKMPGGLAPHAPSANASPEAGCTTAPMKTPVRDVGTCCRCASEKTGDGPRGGGGGDQRPFGSWHLGANLLRRVRRPAAKAGAGYDHWQVARRKSYGVTIRTSSTTSRTSMSLSSVMR